MCTMKGCEELPSMKCQRVTILRSALCPSEEEGKGEHSHNAVNQQLQQTLSICTAPDDCFRGLSSDIFCQRLMARVFSASSDVEHFTKHSRLQQYNVSTMEVFIRYETVLYLTKTFVVETLYYCNPLCYVKCLASLLTLYIVKMHFINVNHIERDRYIVVSCLSQGHAAPTVAPPFLPVEGRTPSSCCSQRLGLARRMCHHMSEEGPVFLCVHLSEFMTSFCTHTYLH